MTHRTLLLSLSLCCVIAAAFFFFARRDTDEHRTAISMKSAIDDSWPHWQRQPPTKHLSLDETYARIHAAEQLSDKAKRCLTYPDPPWLLWDRTVIEAFCRSRSLNHVSLEAIQAALDAGDVGAVEKEFTTYLEENYSRPEHHGILPRVYRELFWSDSEQVHSVVERWVALAPRSAFALAARGSYFLAAAESARGENFVGGTPEENFVAMRRLAAKAEVDLRDAAKQEPKLTSTYDSMIFVGRLISNRELVNFALDAALKADPTDERFYLDWMAASEPRWGGSLLAMAGVADKAAALAKQNPLMKLPVEKQHAYFGVMASQNNDNVKALRYFDDAFAYGPSPVDLANAAYAAGQVGAYEEAMWYYTEAIRFDALGAARNLRGRAWAWRRLGRSDFADDDLRAAAAIGGEGTESLREKGEAFAGVHQYAEAEKAYLAALNLSPTDEESLEGIAELYLWNLKQRDKAKTYIAKLEQLYPTRARTWDLSAQLADGVDNAKQVFALKRYLELVDIKDPYELACIERSKKRLTELQKQN